MVVHYAVIEDSEFRPLCGNWAGSPSWTRAPAAVTCRHCRELLGHASSDQPEPASMDRERGRASDDRGAY